MQDKEVELLIDAELKRQQNCIELIASENIVSKDVLEATGSILTNKYAEGYPNKRYYNGCTYVDKIEQLAIDRCKQLFGCEHVNVQPHSGSQANMAVYMTCLQPGDTILAQSLDAGGHLTHGSPVNFSGKLYNVVHYGVNDSGFIDMDNVRRLALEYKPKLIVCGASNYSQRIDFTKFKEIADEVGSLLLADISHIAGIIAAGYHMSPIRYADFVTTTTHKSLRGPRGAIVMCKQEWAKKLDSTIFPGMQGGPLEHVIAAKAVCFGEALTTEFKRYILNVITNATVLCETLKECGVKIVSDCTVNHLMTIDLRDTTWTGKDLANELDSIGITANKNTVPNDPLSPFITSGVRIGTPAITSRGFTTEDVTEVGHIIANLIQHKEDKETLRYKVKMLCDKYPIYKN